MPRTTVQGTCSSHQLALELKNTKIMPSATKEATIDLLNLIEGNGECVEPIYECYFGKDCGVNPKKTPHPEHCYNTVNFHRSLCNGTLEKATS